MRLEQRPNQTTAMRQSLFAGDRMDQAFAILKMPVTDLREYLREAINENPLLEEVDYLGEEGHRDAGMHPLEFTEEDFQFVAPFSPYLDPDEEKPSWEERIPQPDSLSRHLLRQAEEEFDTEEERLAALYLIGSLESDGTLLTPIDEIASFSHIPLSVFIRVFPIMRGFDPPGVFTGSAQSFDKTSAPPVHPDIIQKGDTIEVVDRDLPRFRLHPFSTEKMDSQDKAFVRERLQAARWLMKNLETRARTLQKIGEAVYHMQRPFFSDQQSLLPLTYKEVAENIHLHPSTVARAVDGKWFSTERGIFPLKAFFPEKIENSQLSSEAVKEQLIKLVQQEDSNSPLSDEEISKRLGCSRRVIAKYRSLLGIPSSRQRILK